VIASCEKPLDLKLDYLDLYLLHWFFPYHEPGAVWPMQDGEDKLLACGALPVSIEVNKKMAQLSRTGVSLDDDLLKEFDRLIAKRGYANRSEAFRDLMRDALLSEMVESNKPLVGTLTIVYDHHVPNLAQKLTEVQHNAGAMILAATHIHLDHHYCLEVIIMKGRGKDLQAVADGILALRGVELGKLVLTNSGASLKHATHSH
jgi:CopG family nickel-responsive transcriptional regulator